MTNDTKMSFRINCDVSSISILLLLNVGALMISNGTASTVNYSPQPLIGDDGDYLPMSADTRRTNARRPEAQSTNQFDDGQQQSFSIRLRDLQNLIGQLVDDEQTKIESDGIAGLPNRRALNTNALFNDEIIERVKRFAERYIFQDAAANALQTSGRVFLFKGLHHSFSSSSSDFY